MIIKKKKSDSTNQNNTEMHQGDTDWGSAQKQTEKDKVELDFENLDFAQRNEARRGNRRRGYRRIDDRKLISRAQEESVIIKEKALKEGFEKGLEMAQSELAKIRQSFLEIADVRQAVYNDIADDILDISVAIAKKIINQEISQDRSIILDMISKALNECAKNESKITLKVSNENYDYVKESIPKLISGVSADVKMNVIAVNDLEGNNVKIETGNGVMDISCDTQLKVLQELFKSI